MKKLLTAVCAFIMLSACNQSTTANKTTDTTTSATSTAMSSSQSINIPYTPMYATDFEFGDYKDAQVVFNLWKHYDNNDFTNVDSVFADTVSMDFPNGGSINGKDALNNAIKKFRGSVSSAKSNVVTYVVLKPKHEDETWVRIWGNEIDTYKDNTTDTTWMNENWKFNKDRKIAYISQYAAGKNLIAKK